MISCASNTDSPPEAARGDAASGSTPTRLSPTSLRSMLTEGFKRAVTKNWQSRTSIAQFFAVVRHSERADGLYSFTNGGRWCNSDDCKRYPFDPPLSDKGVEQAIETGHMLKKYADLADTAIHVIVTSPYARCIQTAEAIAAANPGARLVIDQSLGEIYGPSTMGSVEPKNPIRTSRGIFAFMTFDEGSREKGRSKFAETVGEWPDWPEDLRSARLRFASRFLTYLNRSNKTKRNFVLVTHGDCVAVALAMMPSQASTLICGVDYGGLFIGTRPGKELKDTSPGHWPMMEKVATTSDVQTECPTRLPSRASNCTTDSDMSEASSHPLPKSSDMWEVETFGIQVRQRIDERPRRRSMKYLKDCCMASSLTQSHIEHLLGQRVDVDLKSHNDLEDIKSDCSMSTYLFGQSHDDSLPSPRKPLPPVDMNAPTIDNSRAPQATVPEVGLGHSHVRQVVSANSPSRGIATFVGLPIPALRLDGRLFSRRVRHSPMQHVDILEGDSLSV